MPIALKDSGIKLKAGFSVNANAVILGRDNESVVSLAEMELGSEGLPRAKSIDGSSLLFIVRSFLSRLDAEDQYYDLCKPASAGLFQDFWQAILPGATAARMPTLQVSHGYTPTYIELELWAIPRPVEIHSVASPRFVARINDEIQRFPHHLRQALSLPS